MKDFSIIEGGTIYPLDVFQKRHFQKGEYYFMSNDLIKSKIKYPSHLSYAFIGIANPHSLHLLCSLFDQIQIKKIILIDNNPEQLIHWVKLIVNLINSNSRIEYLEKTFKVHFNHYAKRMLTEHESQSRYIIRGSKRYDNFEKIESFLWKNLTFIKDEFEFTYNLKVRLTESGIYVESKTIGDINKYYVTFITLSERLFKYPSFSADYGCGFLYSEDSFLKFKNKILNTSIFLNLADFSIICGELLKEHKYDPIVLWTSNVYSPYFMKKNSNLKTSLKNIIEKSTQKEPNFPELDLIMFQDLRKPVKTSRQMLPNVFFRNRILSIHTRTFMVVSKYVNNREGLEIVNVQSWIDRDNGISKLSNLKYLHLYDFININSQLFYDILFFHILVGHGLSFDDFIEVCKKGLKKCNRLIILEHNIESNDFKKLHIGTNIEKIRRKIGKETFFEFIPGKKCPDRNFVMVFDRKNLSLNN